MFGHAADEDWSAARAGMLETLRWHGIRDERILAAMRAVPRQRFIPPAWRSAAAYGDHPCSIGHGQTISQPFIVALMTACLDPEPGDSVLEIGTGCGYQTAVLAEIVRTVRSIELVAELAEGARKTLASLGYTNVEVRIGDGTKGWPEAAPFDGILAAAAPTRIPPALLEQLKPGARLVIPMGTVDQDLWIVTRRDDGFERERVCPVRFVPMVETDDRADDS